ncbi:hypothetical protein [Phocoenobacter skyensis]|uniref:YD repeat-containing protein n=2 Tax=Phocoenobacter skyensis TaxID=97481 RepID=A0ABT9JML0_9PAST|nr:hypothetical protein [Pasteurella skyensis]MDP8080057.1 hypothetical protein [Pasteurella skyensis]MDP8086047.1 hypothetical protein [Pasteurella skyensis]MDP8184595.1 hypothetical protein [Pasteurella skyensis]QLB23586.1 hypothetical protein A6B44_10425 [Pasteurella skyensis]
MIRIYPLEFIKTKRLFQSITVTLMMRNPIKNILILLFIFLFSKNISYCKDLGNSQSDWEKYGVKDKVKSYTTTKYTVKEVNGKIIKDKKLCSLYDCEYFLFDNKGNLLEKTVYDELNQPIFEEYYQYDNNGNKIAEHRYINGNINNGVSYKYNTNRDNIEEIQYLNSHILTKITRKYDINHNKIEENTYNVKGGLDYKYGYVYDINNNLIQKNIYRNNGSLEYKEIYQYDKNGNQINKKVVYTEGESKNYRIEYVYNSYGKQIKQVKYDANGSINYTFIYKYDDKNNMIQRSHYIKNNLNESKQDILVYQETSQYDVNRNIIKRTYYDTRYSVGSIDGNLISYFYKYDAKGNNIERYNQNTTNDNTQKLIYQYDQKGNKVSVVEYKNGIATYLTEITYYYF